MSLSATRPGSHLPKRLVSGIILSVILYAINENICEQRAGFEIFTV